MVHVSTKNSGGIENFFPNFADRVQNLIISKTDGILKEDAGIDGFEISASLILF